MAVGDYLRGTVDSGKLTSLLEQFGQYDGMVIMGGVLFLLVAIILFAPFNKKKEEENLTLEERFDDLEPEYKITSNIFVPSQNGMSRIDNVIVSPYGIFVINILNEPGRIIGDIDSREWQVAYGRKKRTIYNPVWRNRTHRNAMEELLGNTTLISLVVFQQGKLKSEFGNNVVELPDMLEFIRKYKNVVLTREQQEKALSLLQKRARIN